MLIIQPMNVWLHVHQANYIFQIHIQEIVYYFVLKVYMLKMIQGHAPLIVLLVLQIIIQENVLLFALTQKILMQILQPELV